MSVNIYYASMTGNVKRFVGKLGLEATQITPNLVVEDKPYILITYTIGIGQVPPIVADFLDENSENMVGVAVSGNRIWGSNFGKAGDIISREFNTPLLLKFELGGLDSDVEKFKEEYDKICSTFN